MNFNYHPKLVEHFVRRSKKTVFAVSITSLMALWIYRNHIPLNLQVIWFTAQSIFLCLRYYNASLLQKSLDSGDNKKVQLHTHILFYLMIYSALLWNMIVLLGFLYAPDKYALFSYIMVAGLINGAILSLSSLVRIYIVYFLLLLIPQVAYMYLLDGSVYDGVLLLTVIYMPYVVVLSKLVNRNLVSEIQTNEALKKNVDELYQLSITDPLTKAYNRHYFFQTSENLIKISKRENKKISLLMLDLDNFKKINDTYGHNSGDIVLMAFAKEIRSLTRESDVFARIGGEEFAVFLYGSSLEDAKNVAQKICSTIERYPFIANGAKIDVTVSIGIATLDDKIDTLSLLYSEADKYLYKAKSLGRNRVCC
ncbi:GGDEF domain-containing protein [uncultured Desulfuromusa sp.]|uniref:GGDEF domain-containing protein n=1 Tax=uncultured Desulfuromusa sp. TaxID=219183 RepID=UPI002AA6A761|nr:GGDEF domain-containing protein [uncultured Desulfuromusa sp.]